MANQALQPQLTAVTWRSSGGTAVITCTSLAANAGRQGAHVDRGTAAVARTYNARAFLKPGGTRVVGEQVEVYLKTGDGTHFDNDDGTGDIALSSVDKLRNCLLLGTIQIDENAAVEMSMQPVDVRILARVVAPIFYNRTANSLSATATDFGFDLVPVPDEIQ